MSDDVKRALEPKGWPGEYAVPTDLGRSWWHWMENILTGNLWVAYWDYDKRKWLFAATLARSRRPEDMPRTWNYLGPALPPQEFTRLWVAAAVERAAKEAE